MATKSLVRSKPVSQAASRKERIRIKRRENLFFGGCLSHFLEDWVENLPPFSSACHVYCKSFFLFHTLCRNFQFSFILLVVDDMEKFSCLHAWQLFKVINSIKWNVRTFKNKLEFSLPDLMKVLSQDGEGDKLREKKLIESYHRKVISRIFSWCHWHFYWKE